MYSVTIYFSECPLRDAFPKGRCIRTVVIEASSFAEALEKLNLSDGDVEKVEITQVYNTIGG